MNEREMLEKSIQKIGEYLRFGSRPGLERITELLRRLGNPHEGLKVIHVGGTNGKGSVCRYLYSVLEKAGYRTGLFISPYIEEFTERIEFHGKQIEAADLWKNVCLVTEKAEAMVNEGLESPTEFEVLTAVMFCYFAEKNPDVVILEVGLGGRGDSTNVIERPLCTCITSISYDHMNVLGNTLPEIAWEKAGIIKKGVPLVYASDKPEVIRVFESEAGEKSAECINVYELPCQYHRNEAAGGSPGGYAFSADIYGKNYHNIICGMPGRHQVMNALCALTVLDKSGFDIAPEIAFEGIKEARQPGRIEILPVTLKSGSKTTAVLDGSHNEDSVRALTEWISESFKPSDRLLIITGILADKESDKIACMLGKAGSHFIVTEPDNPRKLRAEEYTDIIGKYKKPEAGITICRSPSEAVSMAMSMADNTEKYDKNDSFKALIFTGSLYMIGEIRENLNH